MSDQPDEINVSFDANPAMQEYLADKSPGDKCEGEFEMTLKSQDAKGAIFTVDALIPEGYEKAGDTEEVDEAPAAPPAPPAPGMGMGMSGQPLPTVAAGMVRKKT